MRRPPLQIAFALFMFIVGIFTHAVYDHFENPPFQCGGVHFGEEVEAETKKWTAQEARERILTPELISAIVAAQGKPSKEVERIYENQRRGYVERQERIKRGE